MQGGSARQNGASSAYEDIPTGRQWMAIARGLWKPRASTGSVGPGIQSPLMASGEGKARSSVLRRRWLTGSSQSASRQGTVRQGPVYQDCAQSAQLVWGSWCWLHLGCTWPCIVSDCHLSQAAAFLGNSLAPLCKRINQAGLTGPWATYGHQHYWEVDSLSSTVDNHLCIFLGIFR